MTQPCREEMSASPVVDGRGLAIPLVLRWGEWEAPLPVREIRGQAAPLPLGTEAPPWLDTGPAGQDFDFCSHMRRLCVAVSQRCAELRHIDMTRLLIVVTQARSPASCGLQARLTPLRCRWGRLRRRRRGVLYQIQRYFVGGREMLYLVTFCLPRFLDLSFDEKFVTIFHELYHISPDFNGDIRRHRGRYSVHTRSQRLYDQHMSALARAYLSDGADPALHAFLRLNYSQLQQRHGRIVGVTVPRPKLVPIGRR